MINLDSVISSFNDKGTLLKWLKKTETSLNAGALSSVSIEQIDDEHCKLKFIFGDGSFVTSPVLTLARGIRGETGPIGDTGPIGPQGVRGELGPKGDKGDKGDTGPQGPQGIKGETGSQGVTGPIGLTGPIGPIGPKGDKGETGSGTFDDGAVRKTGNESIDGNKTFKLGMFSHRYSGLNSDGTDDYSWSIKTSDNDYEPQITTFAHGIHIHGKGGGSTETKNGYLVMPITGVGVERTFTFPNADGTVALTSDLTKSAVGLANADNTSDLAKPISTATQTALDAKADATAMQTALTLKQNSLTTTTYHYFADIPTTITHFLNGTIKIGTLLSYSIYPMIMTASAGTQVNLTQSFYYVTGSGLVQLTNSTPNFYEAIITTM